MNFKPILSVLFCEHGYLNIAGSETIFSTGVDNSHMQETVSQIFYLDLSFYFMSKNGYLFAIFSNIIFKIT